MDERQIVVSREMTATRKYTRDGNIWQRDSAWTAVYRQITKSSSKR